MTELVTGLPFISGNPGSLCYRGKMILKRIKLIVCDIDGVLTNGKIYFSDEGRKMKSFCLKDFDTCTVLRTRGIPIAFVTGENDSFTEQIQEILNPEYFIVDCKDKYNMINKILVEADITWNEICYLGDGVYDMEPLKYAGIAVCPADAIDEVKEIEGIYILKRSGGTGCLSELWSVLNKSQYL